MRLCDHEISLSERSGSFYYGQMNGQTLVIIYSLS